MPRFTFAIGKGGVGKTTISSALALHLAASHPRSKVLLLSTDPAHSLADVLQTPLSDRPRRLPTRGSLYARQLDSSSTVDRFLSAQREGILRILESGSLFTREEIAPLLDCALPGLAEIAALLSIHDLVASGYDHVVIDTAPLGHTLRLFELPGHLARFLDLLEVAGSRDQVLAAHFGGAVVQNPYLEGWRQIVHRLKLTLDQEHARLLLVTSPETFSLAESLRAREQLLNSPIPLPVNEIVLNRAVTRAHDCAHCRKSATQTTRALRFLKKYFKGTPVRVAEDPGAPILGAPALLALGRHLFAGAPWKPKFPKLRQSAKLKLEPAAWPSLDTPLTLTIGKGGVGKTTLSAALAFHHRRAHPADPVAIGSIDPAPSLDDIFETTVEDQPRPVLNDPRLQAAEIDAVAEYQRWASRMRRKVEASTSAEIRGVHLDLSFERDLFLALLDVVPPGVDEIFATFRILDLLDHGNRVQIDMAPTGHALEVLRTPGRLLDWTRVLLKTLAHHRTLPLAPDAAVEIATVSQRVRELSVTITNPHRCRVWVVMLPEPLPDHETRRLLAALKEMEIPIAGIFVNRVLLDHSDCAKCKRTRSWQAYTLNKTRDLNLPLYVVPEFPQSLSGLRGLTRLTTKLWRLQ